MTVAIDPDCIVPYVLPQDRGTPNAPRFHLKPLSGPDSRFAIAGAVGTAEEKAQGYYDAVRVSLVAWDNMLDKSGAPAPFSTEKVVLLGKQREVASEAVMKRIGPHNIMLLGNAAGDFAHLTADEVKN